MERGLRVEFTFDDEKLKARGIERKNLYATIKENFHSKGLLCISDSQILAFEGTGRETDFGNVWFLTVSLLYYDWFVDSASSCVYFENGKMEDVLVQVPEIREIMSRT